MSRPNSWDGVKQDLTGVFLPGNTYHVTLSARMLSVNAQLAPKLSVLLGSTNTYTYLGYRTDITTAWTQLQRTYTIPGNATVVVLYVETTGSTSTPDFALDNFHAELSEK